MLRKSAHYFGWATADYVVRAAIGLAVSIVIARYLGPQQFGIYTLCLAVMTIAACLVPLASNSVVMRELVAHPKSEDEILGAQFSLQTVGAIFAFAASTVAIWWQRPLTDGLLPLAIFASLGLLFRPFDAINIWLNTHLKGGATVAARLPAFFAASAARLWLVVVAAPLVAFVAVISFEVILGAAGLVVAYHYAGKSIFRWKLNKAVIAGIFRDSLPILIAGAATQLYMKIDVVMLAAMSDQHTVGIYGVAVRLSEAWYFMPTLIVMSVQPLIQALRTTDPVRYTEYLRALYAAMSWTSIAVALPVTLIATPLVTLLFGAEFAESGPVLAVYLWASVAVSLGIASGVYLVAENLQYILLFRTLLGLFANVVLNFVLIPRWGAMGAAIATVISYFLAEFSLVLFARTRQQALMMAYSLSPAGGLAALRLLVGRLKRSSFRNPAL